MPSPSTVDVVFVQPRIGYMDDMRSKPVMPLSLLFAASGLAREFRVRIVDQRLSPRWESELVQALEGGVLYVGLTASTGPIIGHALEVARVVRRVAPSVPIVWGGTHPSLLPEETLAHPLVDAVVLGDGEGPALEIARRLAAGQGLEGIPGVGVLRDGRALLTPPAQAEDLDDYPPVPLDLVDVARYLPLYEGRRSVFWQTSRGCPYRCRHCYNNAAGRRWRAYSPERVLSAIGELVRGHGLQDVYLVDDNFLVDVERALAIGRGLRALGLTWQIQGVDLAALDRLDATTLKELEDCGLRRLTIGIETGSPKMRAALGKPGTVDDVVRVISKLRPYDFLVFGSFMDNLPGETHDDLVQSVRLIRRLHEANPRFRNSPIYSYAPFPGTPLFDTAVAGGFQPPSGLEGWAGASFERPLYQPNGERDLHFHEGLYLCSLLYDAKVSEYSASRVLATLARLYRPVARFRMDRLEFRWMPEARLVRWLR